jgi:hydroxymethylglutaryl-CoA lyase
MGTPEKTEKLLSYLKIPFENLAVHFHDTYDTALENILIALKKGISVVDSSVGGLGGCPYAKKPAGNVCTENVLFLLKNLGIKTDIDINMVAEIGKEITEKLGKENMSVYE